MLLYLIRHGATKGNIEKRYVGSTDEELTEEAVERLRKYRNQHQEQLSKIQMVAVSPMKRCRQTADILFPEMQQLVIEDFRECDFGTFEYCNFRELDGNPAYQQFIDSFGKSGFPNGEDRDTFRKRCVDGFEKLMCELCSDSLHIALVVHGGTIMSLLDQYSSPHKDYYDWQAGNGEGFVTEMVRDSGTGSWQFTEIEILI